MRLEQVKYTGTHPKLVGKIGMIKDCDDPFFCLFKPLKSNDWFRVHHRNVCDIAANSSTLLNKFNINILNRS